MPEIGERKRGTELGYKSGDLYIWVACEQCGKERWVIIKKGIPKHRFCIKCRGAKKQPTGIDAHNWQGGRTLRHGYVLIRLAPDDFFRPMANLQGYVLEHRLVMAQSLGRCLQRWEIVHHRGVKFPKRSIENRQHNVIENLQLVTDDRHNQITILETRIAYLEKRVTLLEAENVVLKMTGKSYRHREGENVIEFKGKDLR